MTVFRTSLTRMYYAEEVKKETPEPFAEFRVFYYSRTKPSDAKTKQILMTMNFAMDMIEWTFISMMIANLNETLRWEIQGIEKGIEVDNDEAQEDLLTTGLDRPEFDEFYRYVNFMKKTGNNEYNEHDIRGLEGQRMRSPKLSKVSTADLEKHIRIGRAWFGMIAPKQYFELKRRMGIE